MEQIFLVALTVLMLAVVTSSLWVESMDALRQRGHGGGRMASGQWRVGSTGASAGASPMTWSSKTVSRPAPRPSVPPPVPATTAPISTAGAGLDPAAQVLTELKDWVPDTADAGLAAYRALALRAKEVLDALGAEEAGRELTLPEAAGAGSLNSSGVLVSVGRIAVVFDDDAIGILSLAFTMPGELDPYVVTLARFH